MGDTATCGEPGRRLRLDRHPGRRQADARWRRRKRAACWSRWRPPSFRARPTSSIVDDGVVSASDDNATSSTSYAAADRRQIFQRPARLEQEIRQPALRARQGAAEEAERAQDRRPADQARGRGAQGVRAGGLRHRREGAGHGARPHDPSCRRRRGAGEGGRKLDQGHPRRAKSSGTRASSASSPTENGTPSRRREKLKVEWSAGRAAVPGTGRALRPHPQGAGAQGAGRKAERQCRRGVQDRRESDRGRIRMAVPVACQHGAGLRAGRDQGRPGHLLERHAEVPLRAAGAGAHARRAGRQGARHLDDRSRLLRPQRRRRRGHGRRASWRRRSASRCALQYMRDQGTGWDPKGPASIHKARAALDAHGQGHRPTSSPARGSRAST